MTRRYLKEHTSTFIFFCICALSFFLLGIKAGQFDLVTDNSINALRALGYTDYIGYGSGQFGPLEWHGRTEWWTVLSFQDAPPLSFLLQYVSLNLFDGTRLASQIPFLVANFLTVVTLYFLVLRLRNRTTALWASGAYTASSYALWTAQSGYIEGVEVFFISLSFLLFAIFLKEENIQFLYLGTCAFACAVMTKYTAIFLAPALVLTFVFLQGKNFINKSFLKHLVFNALLFLLLLSPVVIYNYYLFSLTGTFDTAISSMLGLPNQFERSPSLNFVSNSKEILLIYFKTSSLPFIFFCILSFFWYAKRAQEKASDSFELFLVSAMAFVFIMFAYGVADERYLAISVPFLAVLFALSAETVARKFTYGGAAVACILVIEVFYSFNTNILATPFGRENVTFSPIRREPAGFNELDDALKKIFGPLPTISRPHVKEAIEPVVIKPNLEYVVLYDSSINYFATRWYFERFRVYFDVPVYPLQLGKHTFLNQETSATVYFIYPLRSVISERQVTGIGDALATRLDTANISSQIVADSKGVDSFKLYTIKPEDRY